MKKALIIGSSGTVGTFLAQELEKLGFDLNLATSQTSPTKPNQVHLNLATQEGIENAFQNVTHAFLISPPGFVNQDELLIPLIQKAKENKLEKVVLMTALGVNLNPESPFRKTEIALENSGLSYNIIRPNWFLQNFNTFWIQGILQAQKIFLPVGNAKGAFIDARDIAASAAKLLSSHDLDNQAFDITGPEALDHDEIAVLMSKATGKTIQYQEITPAEMLDGLLKAGLPHDYAQFLLVILDFFKQGYSSQITPDLEKILGRKGIRAEQYTLDFASAWS